MLHTRNFTACIVLLMLVLPSLSTPAFARHQQPRSQLRFQPLTSHIGETEEVALTVYFIGFPAPLRHTLKHAVKEALHSTSIVDATPWWIPDIPKYGAQDFALTLAPAGLPPELVLPDGMLRYEPNSLTRGTDSATGRDVWIPNQDLPDLVDDVHRNLAIVNNVDHHGALVDVAWKADPIRVSFLPANVLEELSQHLVDSKMDCDSTNPPASFALYSYNVLFDWLEKTRLITEQPCSDKRSSNIDASCGDMMPGTMKKPCWQQWQSCRSQIRLLPSWENQTGYMTHLLLNK